MPQGGELEILEMAQQYLTRLKALREELDKRERELNDLQEKLKAKEIILSDRERKLQEYEATVKAKEEELKKKLESIIAFEEELKKREGEIEKIREDISSLKSELISTINRLHEKEKNFEELIKASQQHRDKVVELYKTSILQVTPSPPPRETQVSPKPQPQPAPVHAPVHRPEEEFIPCPQCGTMISKDAIMCYNCGFILKPEAL